MKHTVGVVTATRAEYGLLQRVIRSLACDDQVCLQLLVTGAHVSPAHGCTVKEIEADEIPIAARLPILPENGEEPVACTIARTIRVFDQWFAQNTLDILLLLGDRYEIFAVAAAAASRHIPIAHISGGDVTLGAADEYYRHCITKMASLHFASCTESAARLVRMGEEPCRVFCVGGLGDENIRKLSKMSRQELCESTGLPLQQAFGLVTYHPETAGNSIPETQVKALIAAMQATPGIFWLITGSNADEGGRLCTEKMQEFAASVPGRAGFVQSLGLRRYLSAMAYAELVVGNSSSGVVETPSFGVPAVNIGDRQSGRTICENVLCCTAEKNAIQAAMIKALSPEFKKKASGSKSPYNGGNTAEKIVSQLKASLNNGLAGTVKVFYDGNVPLFTMGGNI